MPLSRKSYRTLAAVASFAAVGACSLYIDSKDRVQCSRNEDCSGRGGLSANAICRGDLCIDPSALSDGGGADAAPADPVWGCLGKVPALPVSEPSVPVDYRAGFIDVISRKPLKGLTAKACGVNDANCASPLGGSEATTGDDGVATVRVHSGFRGYLELGRAPDISDQVPSLLYALPVPDKARPGEPVEVWGLLSKASMLFIAGSSSQVIVEGAGHVFFHASDCSGKPAVGVRVDAQPITRESFLYYTDAAGRPSVTQSGTEALGIGGWINLPVGLVTLTYTLGDGTRIGSDVVLVRPDTITYVRSLPTP